MATTGSLGALLAETTSLFSMPGFRAKKEDVNATDHFYTDGLACGALFKLILEREADGVCVDMIFFYPNGQCVFMHAQQGVGAAILAWKRRVLDLFDPVKIRTRTQARVAALKEDLMREAWKPARVAAALDAGVEVDEL